MSKRVLCADKLQVTINAQGERTLIVVKDGSAVRFWTDTSNLEKALAGESVEISAHGGECRISVEGQEARIDFEASDGEKYGCEFQTLYLAEALKDLMQEFSPDGELNNF